MEGVTTARNLYGYGESPIGQYRLLRDGKELTRGTEAEVWIYLHRTVPYSVHEAIEHQGYAIEALGATEHP